MSRNNRHGGEEDYSLPTNPSKPPPSPLKPPLWLHSDRKSEETTIFTVGADVDVDDVDEAVEALKKKRLEEKVLQLRDSKASLDNLIRGTALAPPWTTRDEADHANDGDDDDDDDDDDGRSKAGDIVVIGARGGGGEDGAGSGRGRGRGRGDSTMKNENRTRGLRSTTTTLDNDAGGGQIVDAANRAAKPEAITAHLLPREKAFGARQIKWSPSVFLENFK